MKRIVIIDSSYYNFYRFFATLSWYNHSPERKDDAQGVAWVDNPVFMTTYEKMWFENIHKICKQFRVRESDLLFARDGSNAWRYSVYPGYKQTRKSPAEDDPHSPGPVFKYTNEEYHKRLGSTVIRVDKAEGDDIIAVATWYIKAIVPETSIVIITGDHDILQLSGVEIYQLKGMKNITAQDPHLSLMQKVIGGDPSDNIPPAFKGCGKVTAKKLAQDPVALSKMLQEKGDVQYKLNLLLVDLTNIPEDVSREIDEHMDEYFARYLSA